MRIEDALAKAVDNLSKLVEKIDEAKASGSPNSGEVVATLLGKTLDNQASLVHEFGEIAVKTAAKRLGIRGGTKRAATAERDRKGRFLDRARVSETRCPLCTDPMHRPVTIEMIQRHRQHEQARQYVNGEARDGMEPNEPKPADSSGDEESKPN